MPSPKYRISYDNTEPGSGLTEDTVITHVDEIWYEDLNNPGTSGLYTTTSWDTTIGTDLALRRTEYDNAVLDVTRISGYIAELETLLTP